MVSALPIVTLARSRHYLPPGGLVATAEPASVATVLGSCVTVCLWDERSRIGGLNHFLLPHAGPGAAAPLRYGNHACQELLERLLTLGARRSRLRAHVVGGASVVASLAASGLGEKNAAAARRFVEEQGLALASFDTGGTRARKLRFHTDDGHVEVRAIA